MVSYSRDGVHIIKIFGYLPLINYQLSDFGLMTNTDNINTFIHIPINGILFVSHKRDYFKTSLKKYFKIIWIGTYLI